MKRKTLSLSLFAFVIFLPFALLYATEEVGDACNKTGMTTEVICAGDFGAATCGKRNRCGGDGHNGWCDHNQSSGCWNRWGKLDECDKCVSQ